MGENIFRVGPLLHSRLTSPFDGDTRQSYQPNHPNQYILTETYYIWTTDQSFRTERIYIENGEPSPPIFPDPRTYERANKNC